MRDGFRIVDADIHLIEPIEMWAEYVDPAFADRVPQPSLDNSPAWLTMDGRPLPAHVDHPGRAAAMKQRFDEIAEAVDKTPAAVRKVATRARTKLDEHRVGLRRVDETEARQKLEQMAAALIAGDVDGVMSMLAPDVVQLDDGGPGRRAARHPIVGPHRVSRLMVNLSKRIVPTSETEFVDVNGSPGVLIRVDGEPDMVLTVGFAPDGLIRRIFIQLSPDKLGHLS